jgi:hypothetical protein
MGPFFFEDDYYTLLFLLFMFFIFKQNSYFNQNIVRWAPIRNFLKDVEQFFAERTTAAPYSFLFLIISMPATT